MASTTSQSMAQKSTDQISAQARFLILLWMSFQNALHTIFMRYSRSRSVAVMYLPSVAVFWMEMIKLIICLIAVSVEEASLVRGLSNVRKTVIDNPMDTLKVCIVSFVYTVSNNLFYVAATYLDAATFAITSQLKLLTTAIFSVIILRKSLSRLQWTALLILFAGVSMVQWSTSSPAKKNHVVHKNNSQSDAELAAILLKSSNALFGFSTAFIASTLAGFAGVYFEKILKSRGPNSATGEISVWMRNVQLAVSSVPIALATAFIEDGAIVREHGLLYGFDSIVWLTVSWCSIGGLSVAVCIKYTDNIRKNFATSVAIILSTIISVFVFQFRPNLYFAMGGAMVIGAIFMYTKHAPVSATVVKEENYYVEENGQLLDKKYGHNDNTHIRMA